MLKTIFLHLLIFGSLCSIAQTMPAEMQSLSFVQDIHLKNVTQKKKYISFEKEKLNVFVFLSPECPLCKNYSIVLNELARLYKDDIAINGIVPGKAYSAKEVKQYIAEYKLNFPVWIDTEKELASKAKATVTPEVILTNDSGIVIYRGAIDDWVVEVGKKKLSAQNHYLKNAIEQYLNGQPVVVNRTMPKGCFINEF